jgi:hypothetical protein
MSQRSLIYIFDHFEAGMPVAPRGIHDWNKSIPPSHLLMASGKPRPYMSSIDKRAKVAIVADYEPGMARYRAFLRALEATKAMPEGFADEVRAAEAFLDSAKARFVLLEPCEIFDHSKTPPGAQCVTVVVKQIPTMTAQVDAMLAKSPEQLFVKAPKWVTDVRNDHGKALGLGSFSWVAFHPLDGGASG